MGWFGAAFNMHVPSWNLHVGALIAIEGLRDVFTVGICCSYWRKRGFCGESNRASRYRSSRLLRCGSVLCRQILGVRRRDVGAQSRRQRRRDRGGATMPQERARRNRTGRSLVHAIAAIARSVSSEAIRIVAKVLPRLEPLDCFAFVRNGRLAMLLRWPRPARLGRPFPARHLRCDRMTFILR
jgi:hypothetical protein